MTSIARIRIWTLHLFFFCLTCLAFRHIWIEGDYLWTGEGSRLSWSMRLKGKVCDYSLKVNEGSWKPADFSRLTFFQRGSMEDPYFFQLFIKLTQCQLGVRVYGQMICRAVSHLPSPLIHSDIDLCQVEYSFLSHNSWISPFPGDWDPHYLEWFEKSKRVLQE